MSAPTPLQGGLLVWRDLLDHLRGLDAREQAVLLDVLTIALAKQIASRVDLGLADEEAA